MRETNAIDVSETAEPAEPVESTDSPAVAPAGPVSAEPPGDPTPRPLSEKKLAANRANAQKSTGPRTARGKKRSAMNAVRHGLAARASLLPGEDPRELLELAETMDADLRPRGAAQRELVGRIVSISWRLRRLARAEESMWEDLEEDKVLNHQMALTTKIMNELPDLPWLPTGTPPAEATGPQFVSRQFRRAGGSPLERMLAYEQRLDRALLAAMRQFQQLRKMQREEDAAQTKDVEEVEEHAAPDTDAPEIEPQEEKPIAQNEPTAAVETPAESRSEPAPEEPALKDPAQKDSAPNDFAQNEPTASHGDAKDPNIRSDVTDRGAVV